MRSVCRRGQDAHGPYGLSRCIPISIRPIRRRRSSQPTLRYGPAQLSSRKRPLRSPLSAPGTAYGHWLAGPVVNLACQLAWPHYAPAARRAAVRISWVERHRRAAGQAPVTLGTGKIEWWHTTPRGTLIGRRTVTRRAVPRNPSICPHNAYKSVIRSFMSGVAVMLPTTK